MSPRYRTETWEGGAALTQLKDHLYSGDFDLEEIETAIANHSRPKSHWTDANHRLSQLLYDADKMDTKPERFYLPLDDQSDPDGINKAIYYSYVLMVREAMTSEVAKSTLTNQLPPILRLDPRSPGNSLDDVMEYHSYIAAMWSIASMPAKHTVAKYCLENATSRTMRQFIGGTQAPLEPNQDDNISRAFLLTRAALLEEQVTNAVLRLPEIVDLAADKNRANEEDIREFLEEKAFLYNAFGRAIAYYPSEWVRDLDLLTSRDRHLLAGNYQFFVTSLHEHFGTPQADDLAYFRSLYDSFLAESRHASGMGNLDTLLSGRELTKRPLRQLYTDLGQQSLCGIMDAVIKRGDKESANTVLEHLGKQYLQAKDRLNDMMGTDRFVYMEPTGLVRDASVRWLPHQYIIDTGSINAEPGQQLHVVGLSQYHALHASRLQREPAELPQAFQEAVRAYTHALYTLDDYREVCVNLLATVAQPHEVDEELFSFMMKYLVINDDSPLEKMVNGTFRAPSWLEIDYFQRADPKWKPAVTIVDRINAVCATLTIIPPFRPYIIARGPLTRSSHFN